MSAGHWVVRADRHRRATVPIRVDSTSCTASARRREDERPSMAASLQDLGFLQKGVGHNRMQPRDPAVVFSDVSRSKTSDEGVSRRQDNLRSEMRLRRQLSFSLA